MNKIYELKILILVLIPDLYGIRCLPWWGAGMSRLTRNGRHASYRLTVIIMSIMFLVLRGCWLIFSIIVYRN